MLGADEHMLVLGSNEKSALNAMARVFGECRDLFDEFVFAVAQGSSEDRFLVCAVLAQELASDRSARVQ